MRVAVVAVDTLCLDFFAVDIEDFSTHFELFDAECLTDNLTADRQVQFVQIRRFVTPKQRIFHIEFQDSVAGQMLRTGGKFFSAGRQQAVGNIALTVEGDVCRDRCICKRIFGCDTDKQIFHMYLVTQKQVNLTDDAGRTDFVLVFEVCAVTPLENEDFELVFTGVQVFCHIDFARHVADLAVSDKRTVDVEIEAGINPFEMQTEIILFEGIGIDRKRTHIKTARILGRYKRRIDRNGVACIGILRFVVRAVNLVLPTHRYGQFFPRLGIKLGGEKIAHFIFGRKPTEIPFTAKRYETVTLRAVGGFCRFFGLVGDEIGVRFDAVLVQNFKPFVESQIFHSSIPFKLKITKLSKI